MRKPGQESNSVGGDGDLPIPSDNVTEQTPEPVPPASPAGRNPDRRPRLPIPGWAAVAVLVVGLAGVLIGAVLRPTFDHIAAHKHTAEEAGEAKTKVCAAYHLVHQAVLVNTGKEGAADFGAVLAVAANARMALFDGGQFLLTKLDEQPATAADFADAVRSLVGAYQQLAIAYLAEVPDAESQAALESVDAASAKVYDSCQQ